MYVKGALKVQQRVITLNKCLLKLLSFMYTLVLWWLTNKQCFETIFLLSLKLQVVRIVELTMLP